jgi:cation diffusion facilitator CzcD-associated flavoprotein CzcO
MPDPKNEHYIYSMKPINGKKVIIIGAGLSGLAAADELLAKDPTL